MQEEEQIKEQIKVLERKYSPKQVAEAWGVSVMTVYRLLKSGELAGYRIGQQWRIPESALK